MHLLVQGIARHIDYTLWYLCCDNIFFTWIWLSLPVNKAYNGEIKYVSFQTLETKRKCGEMDTIHSATDFEFNSRIY